MSLVQQRDVADVNFDSLQQTGAFSHSSRQNTCISCYHFVDVFIGNHYSCATCVESRRTDPCQNYHVSCITWF